jgi:type IV pili sensor histidine kinase/response regulator
MKKITPFVMLLILLGILGPAHALDPMRIKIRTTVPEEINTVGVAAQYYADVIGYRLATAYPAPDESERIASEQISPLSLTNSVLPVEDAILALLDESYLLVIDHEHKLFSFEKGGNK